MALFFSKKEKVKERETPRGRGRSKGRTNKQETDDFLNEESDIEEKSRGKRQKPKSSNVAKTRIKKDLDKSKDVLFDDEEMVVSVPSNKKVEKTAGDLDISYDMFDSVLFMYSRANIYGNIHKTFENYDRTICLGTSRMEDLKSEYKNTGDIVNNIILFIFDKTEITGCVDFLKSLDFNAFKPEDLRIFIILDAKLSEEVKGKLNVIAGIGSHLQMLSLGDMRYLIGACDNIMARITSSQPSHIEQVKPKAPKSAVINKQVKPEVDYNLLDKINNIRKSDPKDRYSVENILKMNNGIVSARNITEGVNAIHENSEVLKIVDILEDSIQTALDNKEKLNNEELNNAVKARIYSSSVAARELQEIVNQIVDNTMSKIEELQDATSSFNERLIEENKGDIKKLLEVRDDLRAQVASNYEKHLGLAKVVERSLKIYKNQLDTLDNKVVASLENLPNNQGVTQMVAQSTELIRTFKSDLQKMSEKNMLLLTKAYEYANNLIGDYQKLTEVDDIIIASFESLTKEYETAIESGKVVKVEAQRRCQDNLRVIYPTRNSGLRTILDLYKEDNSIILNINKYNTEHSKKYDNAKELSLLEFLDSPIDDYINRGSVIINIDALKITDNEIDRLLNSLDYLSEHFVKYFAVIENTKFEDNNAYPIEDKLLSLTKRGIIFTSIDILEEDMYSSEIIELNRSISKLFNNSYDIISKKIMFNKVKNSDDKLIKIQKAKTFLNLENVIGQVYIPYHISLTKENYGPQPALINVLNKELSRSM